VHHLSNSDQALKQYWSAVIGIVIPIILYAYLDNTFWGILSRNFGLANTWHLVTIDLHTVHNGQNYTFTYPNFSFWAFTLVLVTLNILLLHERLKRVKHSLKITKGS
jgi:hypothetical protein